MWELQNRLGLRGEWGARFLVLLVAWAVLVVVFAGWALGVSAAIEPTYVDETPSPTPSLGYGYNQSNDDDGLICIKDCHCNTWVGWLVGR